MATITKEMTLGEVVQAHPETVHIMFKYGLHCIGCHVATWETIEQGMQAHGNTAGQIDQMVKEMNEAISEGEKLASIGIAPAKKTASAKKTSPKKKAPKKSGKK